MASVRSGSARNLNARQGALRASAPPSLESGGGGGSLLSGGSSRHFPLDPPFRVRIPVNFIPRRQNSAAPRVGGVQRQGSASLPSMAHRKADPKDPKDIPGVPLPPKVVPPPNRTGFPVVVVKALVSDFLRVMTMSVQYFERARVIGRAEGAILLSVISQKWTQEMHHALNRLGASEAAECIDSIFYAGTETIRSLGVGPLVVGSMTTLNQLEELCRSLRMAIGCHLTKAPAPYVPFFRRQGGGAHEGSLPQVQGTKFGRVWHQSSPPSLMTIPPQAQFDSAVVEDDVAYSAYAEGVHDASLPIPWPDRLLNTARGLLLGPSAAALSPAIGRQLKALQVRWHPDRFVQVYSERYVGLDADQKEEMARRVTSTAQRINELRALAVSK